jgi:hypothetical protein
MLDTVVTYLSRGRNLLCQPGLWMSDLVVSIYIKCHVTSGDEGRLGTKRGGSKRGGAENKERVMDCLVGFGERSAKDGDDVRFVWQDISGFGVYDWDIFFFAWVVYF